MKKFSKVIGDGKTTAFRLNHGLGTADVICQAWMDLGRRRTLANSEILVADENTLEIGFPYPPQEKSVTVVVLG